MRYLPAHLAVGFLYLLIPAPASESVPPPTTQERASLEALYAVSVSFVQVQMTVINKDQPLIVVPMCGGSLICDSFAALEQKRRPDGMNWSRTIRRPGGDVSFERLVELKRGEASQLTFQFNPLDWKFPNGGVVRYPGKVRIVILVWPKKEWVGHESMGLEILSNEFEIPSPPTSWGG